MELAKCLCGTHPVLESNPNVFTSWDVFCFNCGRQSTNHPSKQDAVRAWNVKMGHPEYYLEKTAS